MLNSVLMKAITTAWMNNERGAKGSVIEHNVVSEVTVLYMSGILVKPSSISTPFFHNEGRGFHPHLQRSGIEERRPASLCSAVSSEWAANACLQLPVHHTPPSFPSPAPRPSLTATFLSLPSRPPPHSCPRPAKAIITSWESRRGPVARTCWRRGGSGRPGRRGAMLGSEEEPRHGEVVSSMAVRKERPCFDAEMTNTG
ncbi:hypothetical protein E2C01_017414 [Portunus trituberculatus]|uniref:Uncharacterized protein n=1 Tax=Portunus trituberculatus TaxID=210409 RepID=A0A5B7DRL1_PORTR|nr:hypothetical protein [Portunus trituberculatus]